MLAEVAGAHDSFSLTVMTTMFDAPMHDFPADSVMDAEMLPSGSASSDVDWLQTESMMEDADTQKPQEVDMSSSDLQEFEMRDVGDADAEFSGDYESMAPDDSRYLFRTEPQDQEIPDASRAPSPSPLVSSQSQTFAPSMHSEQKSQEPDAETESLVPASAAQPLPSDATTSHQDNEAEEPSSTQPQENPDMHGPLGEIEDVPAVDAQETSTISGESIHSPQLQQQQQPFETVEYSESVGDPAEASHLGQTEESHDENRPNPDHLTVGPESKPQAEPPTEYNVTEANDEGPGVQQVTETDDEGLLLDPPPSVLLSYPFDNSRFAFFNPPDNPHAAHFPALEPLIIVNDRTKSESKADQTGDRQTPLESEHGTQSDDPILLFRERFALYYEPLSLVFEALRADSTINLDGRFDDNVELVISAPELDLTLPEDNIHAREVSLHDLGLLHNGCDLNGPLSLRLDTVSPRFGTRYKAIRDEIVRVVSQQEDEEQRSQLDPGDAYLDALVLHESPEGQVQDEVPYAQNPGHDRPVPSDPVGEHQSQSSEQPPDNDRIFDHEHDPLRSHEVDDSEGQVQTGAHEHEVSEEYAAYNEYEEGHEDNGEQQGYEDAEGEYAEEEGGEGGDANHETTEADYYVEELEPQPDEEQPLQDEEQLEYLGIADTNSSLDLVGESLDDIYESVELFGDGETAAMEASGEGEMTPRSIQRGVPEESTGFQASTSSAVTSDPSGTPELEANLFEEVSAQESVHPDNTFSDAEPLISETGSISRSETPRPSGTRRGQDEVIAYEDAVDDEGASVQPEPLPTTDSDYDGTVSLPTSHSIKGSRAASTASKRSYDEHELDQLAGAHPQHGASSESKRLRVD